MNFQSLTQSAPQIVQEKLEQLKGLRERPDFHPEPSAFHHIQIVTERLLPTGDMNLILAGILHDICKLDTMKIHPKSGYPTSPGHDDAAFQLIAQSPDVYNWLLTFDCEVAIVALICREHMRFHQLGKMRPFKQERQKQTWTDQGIWDYLKIFGAADNMIEPFDIDNLEKSWKFNNVHNG